jgi:hypothetical protein
MCEIDYFLSPFLKLEELSNYQQFSLTKNILYKKESPEFNIDYILIQDETLLMMMATGGYVYLW